MDVKDRAELVRAIRCEMKQDYQTGSNAVYDQERRRDPDHWTQTRRYTSRERMQIARTRSRVQRPRRGENATSYIGRTADGGDASYGEAARRWDLRRPRGAAAAPTWDDGYTSYDGSGERARLAARRRRR